MAKGPPTRDKKRDPEGSGRFKDLLVTDGPSRLDDGLYAGCCSKLYAVGKREKSVAGENGSARGLAGLAKSPLNGVDATREASSNSQGFSFGGHDNGIALAEGTGFPGKKQVRPKVRTRFSDPFTVAFIWKGRETIFLHEDPAPCTGVL